MEFDPKTGTATVTISFWMRAEDRESLLAFPVHMLRQWMDKAVEEEDYEYAAMLRDEINSRNDK